MSTSSRRTFIAASAAFSLGRVLGANDKINIGIVGIGGRGNDHIKSYATLPDARIVALCDVNQAALETGQATAKKLTGEQPKGYDDMRKLFADKDVDAVSITTPNHWHALSTIWACQAGKDVYCEKPACYNVHEGERMIEVARKTGRMVQIGSQSRSLAYKIKAIQLLNEGVIGKVYMAKGLCFKRRPSIKHVDDSPVPAGVNWDMFLGPAPMRPFNALRFKYNWHWFWDTGSYLLPNKIYSHEKNCSFRFSSCNVQYFFAKIWRVNNTPGLTADFTTAQMPMMHLLHCLVILFTLNLLQPVMDHSL